MKYRVQRGMVVALLIVITFIYPLLAPTLHRIDQAHFKLIEKGMTYAQVESILGLPPGEYDWSEPDDNNINFFPPGLALIVKAPSRIHSSVLSGVIARESANGYVRYVRISAVTTRRIWTSRNGSFTIYFDENDRVVSTSHSPDIRIVPPWQRAWRWYKSK